jgi:pimeloyl-ACP methyl ester carboxylesterase
VLPGRSRSRLLAAGHRVITYDRRGFGKSSQPTTGYNCDTFAEDLHKLVTKLKLRDFALGGFSMGGGEVARYLWKYGTKGVSKAVFISAVPPFLLKTHDNQEGVDGSVFEGIQKAIVADHVPTLVIHGDADRILPITASGFRTAKLIKGARLVVVKDGPHCITWTHADEVNSELVNFLGKGLAKHATSAPKKDAVA